MGANTTTLASVLKTVFTDDLVDLLPQDVPLLKSAQKREPKEWEGRDTMPVAIHVERSNAVMAGREGGPIIEADNQGYENLLVPRRLVWGRIGITGPLMKAAKSNRSRFVDVMTAELDGLRDDTMDELGRMITGDGRGILALANGAASGTAELILDAPGGVAGSVNGARFFQRKMKIAILDSTGASVLATRRVTQIGFGATNDGARVTVNSALSATQCPDNAIIVRAPNLTIDTVADTNYQIEPLGLRAMLDDGTFLSTYLGLSRATYDALQASVISSVGALSIDVLQQLLDVASQKGGGKITEHWMHHSVRRSYLALLVAARRYLSTSGANSHDAGFKGAALETAPEFSGKPIYVDKDLAFGHWYMLDPRGFRYYPNAEFDWINEDGSIWDRERGVDSFEATCRWFGNFVHVAPNRCAVATGISTNTVVVHVP